MLLSGQDRNGKQQNQIRSKSIIIYIFIYIRQASIPYLKQYIDRNLNIKWILLGILYFI